MNESENKVNKVTSSVRKEINKFLKLIGTEKEQEKIYKTITIVICSIVFLLVLWAFFAPIFSIGSYKVRPFDFLVSREIGDFVFWSSRTTTVSFYVSKYFYKVFAAVIGLLSFFTIFLLITNSKKMYKHITTVLSIVVVFLFVSMLFSYNYVNIYWTLDNSINIRPRTAIFFYICLALLIIHILVGFIFNKQAVKNELKDSVHSLAISFVHSVLVFSTLFTPLYIFPGTINRMRGLDILLVKADVLSGLPMTMFFKSVILIFVIATFVSFIINILLFVLKRKWFIYYNKYHILLTIFSIVFYALMGASYLITYVDGEVYLMLKFVATSMNTYSYIPLALLGLFWVGTSLAKTSIEKTRVEYKVYADTNNISSDANSLDGNRRGDDGVLDPIPAFTELDLLAPQFNNEYQVKLKRNFDDLTLPKLVNHIINYAKYSEDSLNYGNIEIKTFIAGMAASWFSILQGMSGTGKTSLPKIFMEAIDGICDLVAVESSWRDKNELLGYYNAFTKKYTPKSFTQFLYKASLNKDVPYFIVLDEMNLSRIEYYFSDFLSLMESRENKRFIKLFDVQLYPHIDDRLDYISLKNGHTIIIPENVWFVGTANRDESTFEISDKVYDRAQTINFDKRAVRVDIMQRANYPKRFVSYSSLKKLFDKALTSFNFNPENYETIKKVEELMKPYKISFGNRILKQMEEFIKVYVACSEYATDQERSKYIHEAVDCIILSKVVKKLEFRQMVDVDYLIDEFSSLKLTKCEEFLHTLVDAL